ncbi:SRPBCC family protein [Actinophytocola sp.]|jgi:uncharacterized protein YndB with AHSA1/START domain|uniref:SRPBCC family protein n=1 Tax=Actinophytocola sp. TaxID=1872138 RepID=UPI002EDA1F34
MTTPLRLRARVDAPLTAVRRALTDAEALRTWLAEHAEVDLPHRYAFWGRHTPDGAEPNQRLLHVDDRTLRLEWTIEGQATTTEITVAPESTDATLIEVTQSHVPDHAVAVQEGGLAVLVTFWSLAVANLIAYLEGREQTPKCDFTSRELHAHIDLPASPEEVYESLMDPAIFQRWAGARIDVERHVGGRWAMGGFDNVDQPARIVELDPAHKVTMEWPDMVTTWELEGSAGKTRLTFVHSGFDGEPPYAGWVGWLGGMAELRRFHEVPNWRSMWLGVEMPGIPDGVITIG